MCVLCTMNLVIISIKSLTVTARTKDLLQGNLTRGQFYIKGRAKGHGKKKEKIQKPSKQKRRNTECPLQVLQGHVSFCFVYSERWVWLAQWGTKKNKWMQATSPAIFNNSECRAMSSLAVGERWKLPLNQQSRSSVKRRLRRSSSRRLSYASCQCYSLPLGHDFEYLPHFWFL